MAEERKSSRLLLGIVLAVAVIAGICAYAIPKTLMGRLVSLPEAIVNTLSEPDQLMGRLIPAMKTLDGGSYEITLQGKGNTLSVDGDFAVQEADRRAVLQAAVGFDDLSVDGTLMIDGGEVRLQVPGLFGTSTLRYSFAEDVSGYLAQLAGDELSELNQLMQAQLESDTAGEFRKKVEEIAQRQLAEMTFEKTEPKTLTVDGSERNCPGQKTSIPQETLAAWSQEYRDAYREYMGSISDLTSFAGEAGVDWEQTGKEWDEILKKISSLDIEYYVYKDRLAELIVSVPEKASADLQVQGGATPLEHLTLQLEAKDKEPVAIKREGRTDGRTESASWFMNNDLVLKRDYQTETGALDLTAGTTEFHGTLRNEDGALRVQAERLVLEGSELGFTGEGVIHPKSGLELPETSGKVYNLNTMTENEFMPLAFEVYGSDLFAKLQ